MSSLYQLRLFTLDPKHKTEIGGHWVKKGNRVVFYKSGTPGYDPKTDLDYVSIPSKTHRWHVHTRSQGWWPSVTNVSNPTTVEEYIITPYGTWVFKKNRKDVNVAAVKRLTKKLHESLMKSLARKTFPRETVDAYIRKMKTAGIKIRFE